jgi:hypothetical protein
MTHTKPHDHPRRNSRVAHTYGTLTAPQHTQKPKFSNRHLHAAIDVAAEPRNIPDETPPSTPRGQLAGDYLVEGHLVRSDAEERAFARVETTGLQSPGSHATQPGDGGRASPADGRSDASEPSADRPVQVGHVTRVPPTWRHATLPVSGRRARARNYNHPGWKRSRSERSAASTANSPSGPRSGPCQSEPPLVSIPLRRATPATNRESEGE